MADVCPYCGMGEYPDPMERFRDDKSKRYQCWSYFKKDGTCIRSNTCYEEELLTLKDLMVNMAEALLYYADRGGGRAKDLFHHPLTQKVLKERGWYPVEVKL